METIATTEIDYKEILQALRMVKQIHIYDWSYNNLQEKAMYEHGLELVSQGYSLHASRQYCSVDLLVYPKHCLYAEVAEGGHMAASQQYLYEYIRKSNQKPELNKSQIAEQVNHIDDENENEH